ncbi:hypothetical protein AOA80_07460 [Methanomassiliicoccales archaeon RumEn M1]|nr:hypothetical protein AOA80_07460 [Methanomassiliicoccales archaeon RumEn M1]
MNGAPSTGRTARVLSYDESELERYEVPVEEALKAIGRRKVEWISVDGELDDELLELIGSRTAVDPYEMSSVIVYSRGRARMEDLGGAVFLTWSTADSTDGGMRVQPTYFLLGPDFLISVQDSEGHYEEVIDRLKNERSRLRRSGPGFLLYSMLNATAEEFFDRVEELSDDIGRLEDRIMDSSDRRQLEEVGLMRDRVSAMWRAIWHLREASESLSDRPAMVIQDADRSYFAELFSSFDLLLHEIDSLYQMIPQLIDLYSNSVSQQLNLIVKVLTVFSVVFAPLTLIAGIFGMNFENRPEVSHPLGYPLALLLMITVSVVMLLFFYRKGWLTSVQKRD